MTPDQLKMIGEQLFGKWGWQTRLAKALRVDSSTVRRWISGSTAIPGPAEVALELLLSAHQQNIDPMPLLPNQPMLPKPHLKKCRTCRIQL